MARTVTLLQLRESLRREADLPDYADSSYVTEAEATEYLNDAALELTGLLAEIFPAGYFDVSATLSTAADTSTVDLPADFYQARRLWHVVSSRRYPLSEWRDTRDVLDDSSESWSAGTCIRYRLKADAIELDPIPAGIYTLRLDYVPVLTLLAADGDTFDARMGWDRWVVLTAAIRIMSRQEIDWSDKAAERQRIEAGIRRQAPSRDGGRINRVRNVYDADTRRDYDREGRWER